MKKDNIASNVVFLEVFQTRMFFGDFPKQNIPIDLVVALMSTVAVFYDH